MCYFNKVITIIGGKMFKHLTKFVALVSILFSFSVFADGHEKIIRVVDWQSGVGGITNSYADFIKEF